MKENKDKELDYNKEFGDDQERLFFRLSSIRDRESIDSQKITSLLIFYSILILIAIAILIISMIGIDPLILIITIGISLIYIYFDKDYNSSNL